jgi:hypothetical protein
MWQSDPPPCVCPCGPQIRYLPIFAHPGLTSPNALAEPTLVEDIDVVFLGYAGIDVVFCRVIVRVVLLSLGLGCHSRVPAGVV